MRRRTQAPRHANDIEIDARHHGVERKHHEREQHLHHAHLHADHVEEQLLRLSHEPEREEQVVHEPVPAQDHEPRECAHEHAGPEGDQQQHCQHPARARRRGGHQVREGVAQQQRDDRHQHADLERVGERFEIRGLARELAPELEGEAVIEKAPPGHFHERVDVDEQVEHERGKDERAFPRPPEPNCLLHRSTTSSPRYAARVQFITIHFAKRSPWLSRGVLPSGPGVLHQSVFHQNWFLMFSGDVARSAASAADRNSNAPLLLGP